MERAVAVLGTGTMGRPIAVNLARAGFVVRAWNRTSGRAASLERDGVIVASTAAAAIDGAEVVITMLSDGDAVLAALDGGDALERLADDGIWVQMSTIGISATERCAELAERHRVTFVDVPVLGTRQPAERGELIVLASGPDDARRPCDALFDVIGSRTIWLGDAGTGTRTKLVVNGWLLTIVEGLAETLALAEALAIDPAAFLDVIKGGALDIDYAQMKGRAMLKGDFDPSFALRLADKDASLVAAAADRHGAELPLLALLADQFDRAVAEGHGDKDLSAIYLTVAQHGQGPAATS